MSAPRRVMYVITEGWFFLSHFRYMAEAARDAGFGVTVVTRAGNAGEQIRALGFDVIDTAASRSEFGIASVGRNIWSLIRAVRSRQPDIIHLIALRSILLGSVASYGRRKAHVVAAPTGLGHAWSSAGVWASVIRFATRCAVRDIRRRGGAIVFENHDDPQEFKLDSARDGRVVIVPGAGVDPDINTHQPLPPRSPLRVAVVARMLRTKGVTAAVETVQWARRGGHDVHLDIYGAPDPENPASYTVAELEAFSRLDGVHWHGHVADMRAGLAQTHAVIHLTGYREGIPRALVEGAAAGRVLLATDVPGCREIVRHGVNGFLVSPANAVADAVERLGELAAAPELVARMAAASRAHFEAGFTRDVVTGRIVALYRELRPKA